MEEANCSIKVPSSEVTEVREFNIPKRSLLDTAFEMSNNQNVLTFSNLPFRNLPPEDTESMELKWDFEITKNHILINVHGSSSKLHGIVGSCRLEFISPATSSSASQMPEFISKQNKGRNTCEFFWGIRIKGHPVMFEWTDSAAIIRVTLDLELISGMEAVQPKGLSYLGQGMTLPAAPATTYEAFFMSDFLSDFSVASGSERWPAHKVVLAAGSEVFKQMFQSDGKEVQEGQIIIPEVDPEAVKQMLQFLYKGNCEFEEGNSQILVDLFKLGHVYEIGGLRVMTVRKIVDIISVDNAPEIYALAGTYGQNWVMEKALRVARLNREGFSKNPEHLKMLMETYPHFMFQLFNNA